ncbi:MAG: DUF423 domain-containing protein [Phycisphaerales bacterium]|nr:DUF423 domain-containing protein [Phycisphaerales bacterium]
MTWNIWAAVAAVNGMISVAAGAFGAHALRPRLSARHMEIFETAARYHMYHALALLAVAWLMSRNPSAWLAGAGWSFGVGIVFFTGSLYAVAVTGLGRIGFFTPIGGLLLMIGWLLLAVAAVRSPVSFGS